jgi:signal transduction histidine kinase
MTVEVDVPDDLPPILGERSEMMQILINLATNAIEAMESGGRLQLRVRLDPPAVVIEVEDSGPGIPPEKMAAIWEPFHTTKPEGTGLGLSIVRGLVDKRPGATIGVRSVPGAGATFTLRMPAQAGPESS